MNIPLSKPHLSDIEKKAIEEVLDSGWITQGPKVEEFEAAIKKHIGAKYAVAVSSGTAALHLALIVAGVKKEDEVICPSFSFIATANAIRHIGAVPVFADVNRLTYNMEVEHIEELITSKTKAIMPVHQIGMPSEMKGIIELADKYNLNIIEDAACALGSEYYGNKIGEYSELACFSFHPRKIITTGEGGMIVTSNKQYYEQLVSLRNHGLMNGDYIEVGYNYRMSDIHAAIGVSQLKKVDEFVADRRRLAVEYEFFLSNSRFIILPQEPDNCKSNYQSFMICISDDCHVGVSEIIEKMNYTGISVRKAIPNIINSKAYCEQSNLNKLLNSYYLEERGVFLPLFSQMTLEEVKYVSETLLNLLD